MAGTDTQRCAMVTVAIADYGGRLPPVPPVHTAGSAFAALFEGVDGALSAKNEKSSTEPAMAGKATPPADGGYAYDEEPF